jgi:protein-S-isoprenylcysteine O-methyltransferase Ste14
MATHEEQNLIQQLGEEYVTYKKQVSKVVSQTHEQKVKASGVS